MSNSREKATRLSPHASYSKTGSIGRLACEFNFHAVPHKKIPPHHHHVEAKCASEMPKTRPSTSFFLSLSSFKPTSDITLLPLLWFRTGLYYSSFPWPLRFAPANQCLVSVGNDTETDSCLLHVATLCSSCSVPSTCKGCELNANVITASSTSWDPTNG